MDAEKILYHLTEIARAALELNPEYFTNIRPAQFTDIIEAYVGREICNKIDERDIFDIVKDLQIGYTPRKTD